MQPRMSANELALFTSFIKRSERYFEFGAGGSTVLAAAHAKTSVVSVDSSQHWLDEVGRSCTGHRTEPELVFKDIGALGPWGYPVDNAARARWPDYHAGVWDLLSSLDADLYMIDGRFRVACVAQIVLRCRPDALIGFHDFSSRPQYHVVHEIAREIAVAEDMSFFQPMPGMRGRAGAIVEEFRFNSA